MRIIVEKEDRFLIQFDYNKRISGAVAKLPEASLNYQYKRWEVPIRYRSEVMNFGYQFSFDLPEKKSQRRVFSDPILELPKLNQDIKLLMNLYEYQKDGVAYSLVNGPSINGDAPGAGKTAQAIATVIAKDMFPCLVICPAGLKYNWEIEWNIWTKEHKALILTDSVKHTWPYFHKMGMYDVFITNYESLKKYFELLTVIPPGEKFKIEHIQFHPNIKLFKSVIIDEAHRCRNTDTIQSKMTYGISRDKFNLPLTGTPIVNKPIDLLPLLLIVNKIHHFGGIKNFKEMCADEDRWPEINYILRTHCYFRREKKDVIKELPDLFRQKVFCELTNREEYDAAMLDLESYLREYRQATDQQIAKSMKGKIMVQIGVLKNISARGKLHDVMEYIDDIIDSGEKIVVFLYLHEVAEKLREHYPDALFFTGAQTPEQKNKAIHDFQKCTICDKRFERHDDEDHEFSPSEHKLIFVNYISGGEGITLTASSRMAHIEFGWTPKDVEQPESREHRKSQKGSVQSSFFLGKNTIDEKVYQVIMDKMEMVSLCTGTDNEIKESVVDSVIKLLSK
jgi:SWI/SNF-related matrix-associated actin-dependent regulator 1 of chromatin subfamily A